MEVRVFVICFSVRSTLVDSFLQDRTMLLLFFSARQIMHDIVYLRHVCIVPQLKSADVILFVLIMCMTEFCWLLCMHNLS